MEKFLLMLLFFHVSSSEKHSFVIFSAGFSGIPDFPDYTGALEVDGTEAAFCNSDKTLNIKQGWVKTVVQFYPYLEDRFKGECNDIQPNHYKSMINNLMQTFNQTKGVHILQLITGCEWDDENGEVDGFMKFGYDGEDFISLDVKSLTWNALKPEAANLKLTWDADKTRTRTWKNDLTQVCPDYLQRYVGLTKLALPRTVLPSVFLLQKSPSSPVTCFATGFFPYQAVIFWRRDGEELFEDVDHGEILPNHDGTFQMSVDLLKAPPEDWRRYECVFQLWGTKEDIILRLGIDKSKIPTNDPTPVAVGVAVGLLTALAVSVVGFVFYRQRKATKTRTERPETLNPETTSMNTSSCTQQQQEEEEEETLNTESLS